MPAVEGVPTNSPPDVRVTLAGSDPPICDHVIDPAQHALSVLENGDPIAAEPRSLLVLILIPPEPAPLMKKKTATAERDQQGVILQLETSRTSIDSSRLADHEPARRAGVSNGVTGVFKGDL